MSHRLPFTLRLSLPPLRWRCWLRAAMQPVWLGLLVVPLSWAQSSLPPAAGEPNLDESPAEQAVRLDDRPVSHLRPSLALKTSHVPPNAAAPRLAEAGILYQPTGLGRGWIVQPYAWEAPALKHRPLYFEEPNLERLGYYYGWPCDGRVRRALFGNFTEYMATVHDDSPLKQSYFELKDCLDGYQPHNQVLQPFVSAAHFFGRVPLLPYMMGVECPACDQYELGTDRPGSPVPYRKEYLPLSWKGLFYQGAAVTAVPFLIP